MVEDFPLQNIKSTSSSRRPQLHARFGRVPSTALNVPVLVVILKPPPLYQHFREHIQPSAAMHFCTFCITALFLDSYITLRIKGGNVGHLILNGLVWKPNGQKESKRPWDVKPNSHNMYYKCKSFVNKNCTLMIYPLDYSCYPFVFNMVSEQAYSCPT